jgi:hypothetical protein
MPRPPFGEGSQAPGDGSPSLHQIQAGRFHFDGSGGLLRCSGSDGGMDMGLHSSGSGQMLLSGAIEVGMGL